MTNPVPFNINPEQYGHPIEWVRDWVPGVEVGQSANEYATQGYLVGPGTPGARRVWFGDGPPTGSPEAMTAAVKHQQEQWAAWNAARSQNRSMTAESSSTTFLLLMI